MNNNNWNDTWGQIDWDSNDTDHIVGAVCQLLINGADPNVGCSCEGTLLEDIVKSESNFSLSDETRRGVACALIAGGADVRYGKMVYEAALAGRDASIVKLLIAAGADANEGEYNADGQYVMPVDAALRSDNFETADLLLDETKWYSPEIQAISKFLDELNQDINHSYIADVSNKLMYFAKNGRPFVETPVKVATHQDDVKGESKQHE